METEQRIKVKGCYHLHIVDPDGTIVGDSGPVYNVVTLGGFQHMLLRTGTGLTGTQWSHVNVGTDGTPATNATALPSEVSGTNGTNQRATATAATTIAPTAHLTTLRQFSSTQRPKSKAASMTSSCLSSFLDMR